MRNIQQWGRRESTIGPPRGYLYTLGASFLACIATGIFIYVRFLCRQQHRTDAGPVPDKPRMHTGRGAFLSRGLSLLPEAARDGVFLVPPFPQCS